MSIAANAGTEHTDSNHSPSSASHLSQQQQSSVGHHQFHVDAKEFVPRNSTQSTASSAFVMPQYKDFEPQQQNFIPTQQTGFAFAEHQMQYTDYSNGIKCQNLRFP